jgi:hypothetical protein
MKCTCGGDMVAESQSKKFVEKQMKKHRPWSKNRRIAKKQEKRFKASRPIMAAMLAAPLLSMSPPFRCGACGKLEPHYSALGRNLITIEPLPQVG